MTDSAAGVVELGGVAVLACLADGPPLASADDALQLIGDAFGLGATTVLVPASRLAPEFFRLDTRVAGEIVQKFVNYRLRLAVVGDVSEHLERSSALRAFVAESNRGGQLWFVADADELAARLSGA